MADLHSGRPSPRCRLRAACRRVEAGRAMLAEGGNALEAMVAMAASIAPSIRI